MNADKAHKEIVDGIKSDPNHRKEKAQIHAVSGLGVTGVLGSVGLDALDFFGDNVAEFIGGGTGAGIIMFFLVKFFIAEVGELNNV